MFFQIQSLQLLIFCIRMIRYLWPIWIMFFWIIKVNLFLYLFIILIHLISSSSLARSLIVPYAYVSIESIDCILLLSFELKEILLTYSVKTFCLSHLKLCCIFNIDLLFFINSLWFILYSKYYLCQFYFFQHNLFYSPVKLLLNSIYNFHLSFFLWHTFLCLLLFYLHYSHLLIY